ncbi:MAG: mitofilin family membrane protein [Alphaproteobacteria bacterium]
MSDADKDKKVDGDQPEADANAKDDVFSLDEEIAEATLAGSEADPATTPDSGDDILPGGDDETVTAADTGDSLGGEISGEGGDDSLPGAGTDYSLAGDAAEAGVEAHDTPAPGPTADPGPSATRRIGTWALVLLVVFLAGVAVWPVFGPAIESLLPESWRQSAVIDTATQDRLTALESELAALRTKPATPDSTAAVQELRGTVAAQASAIETLQAELDEARAATPPAADTSALEKRLDEMAARIETLSAIPAPSGDGSGDSEAVAALRAELANVTQQLAALGGGQDALATMASTNAALQEQVETLQGRLAALESAAGSVGDQERKDARILALSQLASELRAGGGHGASLQAAKTLASGDDDLTALLDPLQASAATGAPRLRQLQQRFDAVAPEIVRAAIADSGGDWIERTTNRLASLVTIRRVGEVEGDSVEAIVARAEIRLGYGDLAAAVAELAKLEGPPAEAAAGWLASARERLAADAAADEIQRRVATLVGAG